MEVHPPLDPPMDRPSLDEEESELVLALTTEASLEQAETLATALLARGLVACVSLMPIVSHYRWQGRLIRDEEVQLLLKTRAPRLEALHAAVLALHSYDTPEWITLTGRTRGGYARWCAAQLEEPTLRAGDAPPAPPGSPGAGDPAG